MAANSGCLKFIKGRRGTRARAAAVWLWHRAGCARGGRLEQLRLL